MPVLDYDTMEAVRPYLYPASLAATLALTAVAIRLKRRLQGGVADLAINAVVIALFLVFVAALA